MSKSKSIRCAIYTRKSTEDGLDQEYNSLDAQREAAEAYIKSQQHEGWVLIPQQYDDGGFSGGTMDRPALKNLMNDIERGKVDMVVVYKVDRLSRSLHDFAKMVELFDQKGVSFVSVTQQFNTSSSMGRLTLNVLLSFAQFEREVTAERIRDKFAASKMKGMWMGGKVPLGYDVIERKLIVNLAQAEHVLEIFDGYLRLKSAAKLLPYLEAKGIRQKKTHKGLTISTCPLTENALYTILKHPVYMGKIHHQGKLYDGQHEAIIDKEVWDAVQESIKSQARSKDGRFNPVGLLLQRKIHDAKGKRYRVHFTDKPGLKRHHYYVSQCGAKNRIPAKLLEDAILSALAHPEVIKHLNVDEEKQNHWRQTLHAQPALITQTLIQKIILGREGTWIQLKTTNVDDVLVQTRNQPLPPSPETEPPSITLTPKEEYLEILLHRSYAEKKGYKITRASRHNATLLTAIGNGYRWERMLQESPKLDQKQLAKQEGVDCRYLTRALHLMMLAPDIIKSILDGTQPDHLSLATFRNITLPICWQEQRKMLGVLWHETV